MLDMEMGEQAYRLHRDDARASTPTRRPRSSWSATGGSSSRSRRGAASRSTRSSSTGWPDDLAARLTRLRSPRLAGAGARGGRRRHPSRSVMRLPSLRLLPLLAAAARGARRRRAARRERRPGERLPDHAAGLPAVRVEDRATRTRAARASSLATAEGQGLRGARRADRARRATSAPCPSLYRKPQRYADFLGQELVYYYKGPLLIVMPNGFGIFQNGKPLKEDKQVLAKLPPPGTTDGDALAASAEKAVRALAQQRGITLAAARPRQGTSSKNRDRVAIVAGVILLCRGRVRRQGRSWAGGRSLRSGVASLQRSPCWSCSRSSRPGCGGGGGGADDAGDAYRGIVLPGPAAGAELQAPRPARPRRSPSRPARPLGADDFPLHLLPGRVPRDRRQPQRRAAHARRARRPSCGCSRSASTRPATRPPPRAVRPRPPARCRRSAGCSAPARSSSRSGTAYNIAVLPGAKGTVSHYAVQLLIDPAGRERLVYDANVKTADVVADLRRSQMSDLPRRRSRRTRETPARAEPPAIPARKPFSKRQRQCVSRSRSASPWSSWSWPARGCDRRVDAAAASGR